MYKKLFEQLAINKPSHNVFSPSGSKRWIECHGWFDATKNIPNRPSGAAAQRGTEIHSLMDKCIANNEAPENLTNDVSSIECVGYVMDFINRYKTMNPMTHIFSEVYIPFKTIMDQPTGGTIDIIGINGNYELMIGDLKTGSMIVDVENNPQLLSYAIAARLNLGVFEQYRLVIIQPTYHPNGPIREWVVTNDMLDAFEQKMEQSIIANINGGDRLPGDWCKYCGVESTCKPRATYILNKAGLSLNEFIKELENE